MQIILMASFESGQVGFPPENIEGFDAPRRMYSIVNGRVILSGYPDTILHHDVEQLLHMVGNPSTPGYLYRMPTPLEQEQMTQAQEQASIVQESIPIADEEEPPAQSKKQKASGG